MSIARTLLLSALFAGAGACAAHGDPAGRTQDTLPYDSEVEAGTVQDDSDGEDAEVSKLSQGVIGPNDVGVIAPDGMNCPNEHVMLTLDNERDGNWNDANGWIGAIEQDHSVTKLHFCRVDGRNFRQVRGTSTALNYAVLKLGSVCPTGSVEMDRYFDNEDRPSGCPSWPWACAIGQPESAGDFWPNSYASNNLHLKLCMFRASSAGSDRPFPRVGVPYGVFGSTSLPGRIDGGTLHTDDEDDGNANHLTGDTIGSSVFLTVGANTTFQIAKVNPMLRGIPLDTNIVIGAWQ